ncbi:hypothetical protein DMENIID0001_122530 [Sergentomyia squamirostris]
MAQQQNNSMKGPEIPAEMLKATQDLAAQAALRAQERLQKVTSGGGDVSQVPEIPARGGGEGKVPPEIPPKRLSLKKNLNQGMMPEGPPPPKPAKVPPPLPQKPQSSPQMVAKLKALEGPGKPINPPPPVPPIPCGVRMTQSPQLMHKQLDKVVNSPQLSMRASATNSPQLSQRTAQIITNSPMKKPSKTISPSEDLGSEDALRGIESGLRNMERAMQEQMTLRSLEQHQQQQLDALNFNPIEYKRTMGGSIPALDATSQQMRALENLRLTMESHFGNNMRSLERGFSMDQMRLEALRAMESNPNIRSTLEELKQMKDQQHQMRPIEHHMRSLDRNLPLELQYSRHHRQQHMQPQADLGDFRDHVRQIEALTRSPIVNRQGGGGSGGSSGGNVSREDLRMRRRSSHDEGQIAQGVPGN